MVTLTFGGSTRGSERPSHSPKVTKLRRSRAGMAMREGGGRVSGGPLPADFEDTRYLPIVTLRNKTGRPDARLSPKTMPHANLREQKQP